MIPSSMTSMEPMWKRSRRTGTAVEYPQGGTREERSQETGDQNAHRTFKAQDPGREVEPADDFCGARHRGQQGKRADQHPHHLRAREAAQCSRMEPVGGDEERRRP